MTERLRNEFKHDREMHNTMANMVCAERAMLTLMGPAYGVSDHVSFAAANWSLMFIDNSRKR
jgi:hypothetical protein